MAPSAVQILIVILIVMVLFGAGRIPTIMENLAKGINSFKKGLKDEDKQEDVKPPPASIEDKRKSSEDTVMNDNKSKSKDK